MGNVLLQFVVRTEILFIVENVKISHVSYSCSIHVTRSTAIHRKVHELSSVRNGRKKGKFYEKDKKNFMGNFGGTYFVPLFYCLW